MRKTTGIFLINKDNKLFVAHPTRAPKDKWSIPKGGLHDDEYPTDGAVREMYEESNIDLSNWTMMHNLEHVQTKNKLLIPFVLFEKQNNIDFSKFEFKCNSNVPEEIGGYPEMDSFKWVSLDEAKKILLKTQVGCIDEIEKIIEKLNKASKKD
jgi:8-oxo-dGTP pyrophosphatase MutT (NUDIX family)